MLLIIVPLVLIGVYLFIREWTKSRFILKQRLTGKHVLITGGSSGIGKAIAVDVLNRGANVSIFARDKSKLEETKKELEKCIVDSKQQSIGIYSVDISKSYEDVEHAVHKAIGMFGTVSLLINCAGTSVSYAFEDTPLEDFQRMLNVNYIGSVNVTKAALPSMKLAKEGQIVFVSSLAGIIGLYGFTAYAASKFALVGFSEALQMELKPFNISVTVALPPDTDTPGFEEEQKTKPLATKQISEGAGLVSAQQIASQTVNDALIGKFTSTVGMEGLMLSTVCAGGMPIYSILQGLFQVFTMGLFRIIAIVFLKNCDRTILQCSEKKEPKKDS